MQWPINLSDGSPYQEVHCFVQRATRFKNCRMSSHNPDGKVYRHIFDLSALEFERCFILLNFITNIFPYGLDEFFGYLIQYKLNQSIKDNICHIFDEVIMAWYHIADMDYADESDPNSDGCRIKQTIEFIIYNETPYQAVYEFIDTCYNQIALLTQYVNVADNILSDGVHLFDSFVELLIVDVNYAHPSC